MPALLLLTVIFLVSLTLTGAIRALALRHQILDVPQARSAHTTPTPTGGGLAIVVSTLIVGSFACVRGDLSLNVYLALSGAFFIALIGLIDDLIELRIGWRVAAQFLAAAWALWWLGDAGAINIAGWILDAQWLLVPLAALALVWLSNLYNFMDGIDGIAGSEFLFVNVMSLLFVINSGLSEATLLTATLAAATAGFLTWNWPPARIFMGDVGSGFCGFTLGVLALLTMQSGVMTVWTWLILLGVFVTDATLTLVRRAMARQRWYEGHSSHAYQHAARKYESHGKVTVAVLVINCLWLAPLAYVSTKAQELGVLLSLVALIPLGIAAYLMQAGIEMACPDSDN